MSDSTPVPTGNSTMNTIAILLLRNLSNVFCQGDDVLRRAAIKELYTEDCLVYTPGGVQVGHDALHRFAATLRATHPHYAYSPLSAPQDLHNAGRLSWGSGPRGEPPRYTGVDFIIERDRKIASLYVFLDGPPV